MLTRRKKKKPLKALWGEVVLVTFPTQLKFPRQTPRISSREPLKARVLLWSMPQGLSAAGNQSCPLRVVPSGRMGTNPEEMQPGGARRAGSSRQLPGPAGGMLCPEHSHLEGLHHIPAFPQRSLLSPPRSPKLRPLPALIWGFMAPGGSHTPKTCPLQGCPRIPAAPPPGEVFGDKPC